MLELIWILPKASQILLNLNKLLFAKENKNAPLRGLADY